MNLKFWQPKRKLEVIRVNTTDLRLRAWRSDEHLLSAAKTLQGNHTYAMAVQVLRNELMAMASRCRRGRNRKSTGGPSEDYPRL